MRRFLLLIGCISALALSACGEGSSLPVPTGKGNVRALNAISTSPGISFLIEERLLGNVQYKDSTNTVFYDDFEYDFNFEALFPDEIARRRIATESVKVDADRGYTFVISGALASPDITVWENDVRSWGANDTTLLVQFGHAAESLGEVDVYFGPPGVDPVIGAAIGTLSFLEQLPETELEAGDYVLTIATAAGTGTVFDPATIIYTSGTLPIGARSSNLFTLLDADANDTAPLAVRAIDVSGVSLGVPDPRFPPTIQFQQASIALVPADIYSDEPPTLPIVTNQLFTELSEDISTPSGATPISYTATGNIGAPLYAQSTGVFPGTHNRFIILGPDIENFGSISYPVDRRSVKTYAKFQIINTSTNHLAVDAYLVERGLGIGDIFPRLLGLTFGAPPTTVNLNAGSYDLIVTVLGEKTVLAGPIPIDASLGDIFDVSVLDVVDPAFAQVVIYPVPVN